MSHKHSLIDIFSFSFIWQKNQNMPRLINAAWWLGKHGKEGKQKGIINNCWVLICSQQNAMNIYKMRIDPWAMGPHREVDMPNGEMLMKAPWKCRLGLGCPGDRIWVRESGAQDRLRWCAQKREREGSSVPSFPDLHLGISIRNYSQIQQLFLSTLY